MATCPTPSCPTPFDDPRVRLEGTAFIDVQQDCSPEQGIVLLTDDPGLLNIDDPGLGTFLNSDTNQGRTQEISSFDDAMLHWDECSCIYWDLACFFAYKERPTKINVAYVDSANETLTEGWNRITECPICACQVQVTTCKADGSTWVDTNEYFDWTTIVALDDDWYHNGMTYQAKLPFTDLFETTSFGARASAAGQGQEWTVADTQCRPKRDANCEIELDVDGAVIFERYYLNSGLGAAALKAFYSVDDPKYNFTANSKPTNGQHGCHTGVFLDETTGTAGDIDSYDILNLGNLGQGALINLTGLNDGIGAPITGSTRHYSAFLQVTDGKAERIRYLSSIYVDGSNYGDSYFKEKAINAEIREKVIEYKDNFGTNLTEAGRRAQAGVIKTILDKWMDKGVITTTTFDWASLYNNIIFNGRKGEGEGYVIASTPEEQLDLTTINARVADFTQYCFRVSPPQHGSVLQVCKIPPIFN